MNKLSSDDRSSLLRLASSLPKGDGARRAILAGLKKAAEGQPDPKKKYDLYVAYGQNEDEILKKGLKPSEAAKAMKTVDSVIMAAEGLNEHDHEAKLKKLQDRLDKSAFGAKLNPNGELFLTLKDPEDEEVAWQWTGAEWELA